jgi:hypothetical protein
MIFEIIETERAIYFKEVTHGAAYDALMLMDAFPPYVVCYSGYENALCFPRTGGWR